MIYKEKMQGKILIQFMKQLIKGSDRKVFLILDKLRVHYAKDVKEWLASHRRKIEVLHLPSYSPELNPDAYLNGDSKAGVHSCPPSRRQENLIQKVTSHMRKMQKLPGRVRQYFRHPKIAYVG